MPVLEGDDVKSAAARKISKKEAKKEIIRQEHAKHVQSKFEKAR